MVVLSIRNPINTASAVVDFSVKRFVAVVVVIAEAETIALTPTEPPDVPITL